MSTASPGNGSTAWLSPVPSVISYSNGGAELLLLLVTIAVNAKPFRWCMEVVRSVEGDISSGGLSSSAFHVKQVRASISIVSGRSIVGIVNGVRLLR
jgi:hypothetical protein